MSKQFLIVDDEPEIIKFTTELIKDLFPHSRINTAKDGEEGFRKSCLVKFDLIITDHNMPIKTGTQMIADLRTKKNPNAKTPVLVLSGFLDEALRGMLKSYGIAFSDKPIDIEKFQTELRSLV